MPIVHRPSSGRSEMDLLWPGVLLLLGLIPLLVAIYIWMLRRRRRFAVRYSIVAFALFAELIQPPTTDQEALQAAVQSLTTGRGTAIGSGILQSLDAIAEIDKSVAPSVSDTSSGVAPTPVPKGAYAPDIIVLL